MKVDPRPWRRTSESDSCCNYNNDAWPACDVGGPIAGCNGQGDDYPCPAPPPPPPPSPWEVKSYLNFGDGQFHLDCTLQVGLDHTIASETGCAIVLAPAPSPPSPLPAAAAPLSITVLHVSPRNSNVVGEFGLYFYARASELAAMTGFTGEISGTEFSNIKAYRGAVAATACPCCQPTPAACAARWTYIRTYSCTNCLEDR